ncbi:hypothetical protein LX69_01149 [Breznakibacter xylanolyticus]|uniref:Uncharacterized protein n=2 Tax=Breznakibacter xylanolyticus TaxID=990 RepID=A0A2W7P3Y2_9BACT|nr:hypothetical protein LX69_01149 [Breznakibacter xylanolyticus]
MNMTNPDISQSIVRATLIAEAERLSAKTVAFIASRIDADWHERLKQHDLKPIRDRYPELTDHINALIQLHNNVAMAKTMNLPSFPIVSNN